MYIHTYIYICVLGMTVRRIRAGKRHLRVPIAAAMCDAISTLAAQTNAGTFVQGRYANGYTTLRGFFGVSQRPKYTNNNIIIIIVFILYVVYFTGSYVCFAYLVKTFSFERISYFFFFLHPTKINSAYLSYRAGMSKTIPIRAYLEFDNVKHNVYSLVFTPSVACWRRRRVHCLCSLTYHFSICVFT